MLCSNWGISHSNYEIWIKEEMNGIVRIEQLPVWRLKGSFRNKSTLGDKEPIVRPNDIICSLNNGQVTTSLKRKKSSWWLLIEAFFSVSSPKIKKGSKLCTQMKFIMSKKPQNKRDKSWLPIQISVSPYLINDDILALFEYLCILTT